MSKDRVSIHIASQSRYIISTSGRPSSLARYNTLLQKLLNLDIAYIPINPVGDAKAIEAKNFASALRGLGAVGGAISKDIKFKILPELDAIEAFAQKITSVNTVVSESGKLVGYNTDAHGFEVAIRRSIEKSGVKPKTALIYGYGGVTSVAAHVLQKLDINVTITGRRADAAATRCKDLGLDVYQGEPRDLFVNATPVTDTELSEAPGFLSALKPSKMVFDHHMPGKKLSEYCEAHKIFHIPGTEMYYPQMYRQWELFLRGMVDPKKLPELIASADRLCANP